MNKILKNIEKQLKGLTNIEKNEILAYYEEIILDRLDRGESVDNIENSLNYKEIRNEYLPKTINNRENKTVKESTDTARNLLIFLFASPILIPLGVLYFVVLLTIYILIISFWLVIILVPISFIIIVLDLIAKGNSSGVIFLSSGLLMLILVIIESIFYSLNKVLLSINNYFIKLFSKFIMRKDKNHEEIL